VEQLKIDNIVTLNDGRFEEILKADGHELTAVRDILPTYL
jgi:hypothetical protein